MAQSPMPADELRQHVFSSYLHLRYGAAIIGAVLPLIIYLIGSWQIDRVPLAGSVSAYYWVPDGPEAPSRDWLVGSLFAVAAILYLYKGFSKAENIALNLAAVFAVGVALIPTAEVDTGATWEITAHGFCAVSMFICLAYVVWCCAGDTLHLLPPGGSHNVSRYRWFYRAAGLMMLASPLTAVIANATFGKGNSYVFFVELVGIWAFAAYWLIKGFELTRSGATSKAILGVTDQAAPAKEG